MPALNFQARFAPLVEAGKKRQTIRAPRKDGRDPKAGQTLYLYTGMRTKDCRKLLNGEVKCKSVEKIEIVHPEGVFVSGRLLCHEERQSMAEADGFEHSGQMAEWFKREYGLPFEGWLIRW